jgi:formate/nitrite transporter FocA (FNT family)
VVVVVVPGSAVVVVVTGVKLIYPTPLVTSAQYAFTPLMSVVSTANAAMKAKVSWYEPFVVGSSSNLKVALPVWVAYPVADAVNGNEYSFVKILWSAITSAASNS